MHLIANIYGGLLKNTGSPNWALKNLAPRAQLKRGRRSPHSGLGSRKGLWHAGIQARGHWVLSNLVPHAHVEMRGHRMPNLAFNADANTGHGFAIFMACIGALRTFGAPAPVN